MLKETSTTHNQKEGLYSDVERFKRVASWTLQTPDVALLVGRPEDARKGVLAPITSKKKIYEGIYGVSKKRAEYQINEGRFLGMYPKDRGKSYKETRIVLPEKDVQTAFPANEKFARVFKENIEPIGKDLGIEEARKAFAQIYFRQFTAYRDLESGEMVFQGPEGNITSRFYSGAPVLVFEKLSDLKKLSPYAWLELEIPDTTQAISFVVTKRSRPFVDPNNPKSMGVKNNLEGSLWAACLESCPEEIIDQHVRTQLVFKRSDNTSAITPVLISGPAVRQRGERKTLAAATDNARSLAINNRVKEYILELLAKDDEEMVSGWFADEILSERNINMPLSHISREGSPLDMTDWEDPHLPGFNKREKEIAKEMREEMEYAFEVVSDLLKQKEADKTWQLVAANYLSFFSLEDWQEASEGLLEILYL